MRASVVFPQPLSPDSKHLAAVDGKAYLLDSGEPGVAGSLRKNTATSPVGLAQYTRYEKIERAMATSTATCELKID